VENKDLESNQASEEQKQQVSNQESVSQVSKEAEKVSVEEAKAITDEVRTKVLEEYRQSEEFTTAVQSAKDKSINEEIQKHTKPFKDQIKEMTKAANEAQMKTRENTILETFGDTEEAKNMAAYERKLWERDLDLTEKESAHAGLLQQAAETNRNNIIRDIATEFKDEGVTAEELREVDVSKAEDSSQAKAILQKAAKALAYDKLIAELDKKPPQKIDSGTAPGGRDFSSLSADDKLKEGFRQYK